MAGLHVGRTSAALTTPDPSDLPARPSSSPEHPPSAKPPPTPSALPPSEDGPTPAGSTDGAPRSANEWLNDLYGQLRAVAADRLQREQRGHTLQPTALVHEAWLRLARAADGAYRDEAHFRAAAAQCMREILIDHARRKKAQKRGGGALRVVLDDAVAAPDSAAAAGKTVDLVGLDEALKALEVLDARKCRVVELRFFGGLTLAQIGTTLGVSPKTAEADWYMARAWLRSRLADWKE